MNKIVRTYAKEWSKDGFSITEFTMDNLVLVFSSDDDSETGKGWYLQKFPDGATSQLFRTSAEGMEAYRTDKLKFGETFEREVEPVCVATHRDCATLRENHRHLLSWLLQQVQSHNQYPPSPLLEKMRSVIEQALENLEEIEQAIENLEEVK
jgi:hypothetical protein